MGISSKVSLQACRDELRSLQEQLNDLGREEDALRTQRDLLTKQQGQLRAQLAEQKGRLQLLQAQVARRGDVESQLRARQAELRDCRETASRSGTAAAEAESEVRGLQEERRKQQAQFRQGRDMLDVQVRVLQREADALGEMEKSIDVMQGRVTNAAALKAQLGAADDAVRGAERELEGLRQKLESEQQRRQKREKLGECLRANVRLKTLEAESMRLEGELTQLLGDLGGRDFEALQQDLEAARQVHIELEKTQSFRQGELTQTREAARQIEAELASPLYARVEERHREAVIKHESAAFASSDLARYHSALDKALMKFHSAKMAEINRTIKELWQRVYRGRDIDFVAIRSDTDENEDGTPADAAAAGRALRNYNYRVVMVCGDAEMEMRGRCSAGQRVLCSLIIRLALADSFCVSCGVLALDEPTTNLDSANIRGLAEALSALIEARRGNGRFQLILITHDDVFVSHLQQLQVSDWYYQISKDDQGFSKVTRKEMRNLGG